VVVAVGVGVGVGVVAVGVGPGVSTALTTVVAPEDTLVVAWNGTYPVSSTATW